MNYKKPITVINTEERTNISEIIKDKNSNCCNSFVYVDGDEEGTHYYVCSKCHKPCDIKA